MVTRWISDCSLSLAVAASGAGDDDTAVKWLTKAAVKERDPLMILIGVLPITRHLRNHSGFRTLLTEKMGLRLPSEP
jgi:cell division inhibitor SulA